MKSEKRGGRKVPDVVVRTEMRCDESRSGFIGPWAGNFSVYLIVGDVGIKIKLNDVTWVTKPHKIAFP